MLRNEQTKQIQLPEVYIEHEDAKKNVALWMNAQFISEAAPKIINVGTSTHRRADKQIPGKRLTDKFRKKNQDAGYKYTPGGRLPPRPKPIGTDAPPTPSSPFGASSPPTYAAAGTPASPPRQIVGDFKAFGGGSGSGSQSLSVFGAPLLKTGPGGGMFGSAGLTPAANGGMRGGNADDDDDDDDDTPAFKRDAISLDQVGFGASHAQIADPQARRIATQSVFRAGRF